MKINVIRNLIIPWILFFALSIIAIVVGGVKFPTQANDKNIFFGAIAIGVIICLFLNIRTLSRAGIWIAHSLPSSLRYNSRPWLLRALEAGIVALAFYLFGQMSWIPLVWPAFVLPTVFTITLFVGIWSLMGPILTWASKVSFSRVTAFLTSLPVFALVPLTAIFLGKTIVTAYLASRPELIVAQIPMTPAPAKVDEGKTAKVVKETAPNPTAEKRAQFFHDLAESGQPCYNETKDINAALATNVSEDVVYWAVKAIKCSDMPSIVALPKLAKLMVDHPSPKVRAVAIRAMPRYGYEKVHQISYLIVKRINEKEAPEVVEAAASVLSHLGEDEKKWSTNRLKALLDSPRAATEAARFLVEDLKREDLVTDYVSEHLTGSNEVRARAVAMICVLPKASRSVAEPHIDKVVASVQTGAKDDPAMVALDCLGRPGFEAIRQEVVQPQRLERAVAARALAEMNVKSTPEVALETAQNCVRDSNEQVRKWCSQSLGKIGVQALPKILDLLKSNDSEMKEAGRNALNFFDDPDAKKELEKVRAENSGWLANKKKLQVAEAVNTALIKIETDENRNDSSSEVPAVENK